MQQYLDEKLSKWNSLPGRAQLNSLALASLLSLYFKLFQFISDRTEDRIKQEGENELRSTYSKRKSRLKDKTPAQWWRSRPRADPIGGSGTEARAFLPRSAKNRRRFADQ